MDEGRRGHPQVTPGVPRRSASPELMDAMTLDDVVIVTDERVAENALHDSTIRGAPDSRQELAPPTVPTLGFARVLGATGSRRFRGTRGFGSLLTVPGPGPVPQQVSRPSSERDRTNGDASRGFPVAEGPGSPEARQE